MAYLKLSPADPRTIGPYRLLGRLGTGRTGQTFLAQAQSGTQVALKVFPTELAADPEFLLSLSREVAAARRVAGEFTAAVVDAELAGPFPWLATAYVPGPTLAQVIDRQVTLPGLWLLALGTGMAEGLREIHGAGVVHRDLKPANVVLGDDGPRIVDFGIALTARTTGLAGEAATAGTVGFMSPEQATGAAVGPASDIFSLGAVLTVAATGMGPFEPAGSVAAMLYRVINTEPDLAVLPEVIRPVVARCLAKDPAARPSAAELATAFPELAARDFRLDRGALRARMRDISAWSGPDDVPRDAPMPDRIRSSYLGNEPEWERELELGAPQTVAPEAVEPESVEPETAVPPRDDGWGPVPPAPAPPVPPPPATHVVPRPAPPPAPVPEGPDPAEVAPAARFLTGDLPERAPAGIRLSLQVMISLRRAAAPSAALKSFPVSPSGTTVVISVSAPGLVPQGDLEQDLFVPFAADSEPVRFGFVTGPAGLHTVVVRAFSGGTFLGELALQVSVEPGAVLEQGRSRSAELTGLAAEPGEVTLQVSRTDEDRYSFQLIGEAWNPVEVTRRLAGDPTQVVGALVDELRAMSANESRFASPVLVRNRIRNLGAQLWADVVPEAIRRQFWEQGDRIRQFTIASDMDTVPWELLYPVDGHNDNGFLVEQFPVVRRVYGQGRTRVLRLDGGAAYIVPPGSPVNAMAEVEGISGIFPGYVRDRGVHATLAGFNELLDAVPSVLHFACHNAFTEQGGSVIRLGDGPLRPSDLAIAVQQKGLAAISPLVFLNACRTAGDIAGLMQLVGWARQFMGAGAGAFIGSLWAVRSSSAKTFAEAFYRAMISDGMSLGAASLRARQEISGDPGDPTWLAYTVYGNPSAEVGQ